MEIITIRIPLYQIRQVEKIANSSSGQLKKSDAWRAVITSGLEKRNNKQQRILVEILMILRNSIGADTKQYSEILKAVDIFTNKLNSDTAHNE